MATSSIRTKTATVVFARPFRIEGYGGLFAAGAYTVETDEQQLEGVSFAAFQRVRTAIYLDRSACRPGDGRIVIISGAALDAALGKDRAG